MPLCSEEIAMSPDTEALFQAARLLPEQDRMSLVSRLLETLPDAAAFLSEDDPDFIDELNRRLADDEGAVDAQDLLGEM
jgi:hypothetical protein